MIRKPMKTHENLWESICVRELEDSRPAACPGAGGEKDTTKESGVWGKSAGTRNFSR